MNREVFFVADDFGLDAQANAAIIAAHLAGALHGASLMMGQAATDEAVALARAHPTLQVGWHLHLCDSRPVSCPAWPWGDSYTRAGWAIGLWPRARALMRREVSAQWEQFEATGLRCAFVNSHHHLHAHPMVYAALLEVLPAGFDGWIRRGGWGRRCRFRVSDTLWGVHRTYRMQASEVRAAMAGLPAGLHEFLFHPRRTEDDRDFAALMELSRR
jgi:predicted glycoside hydrolase/deacetylase ChbG (UPF0249 family)